MRNSLLILGAVAVLACQQEDGPLIGNQDSSLQAQVADSTTSRSQEPVPITPGEFVGRNRIAGYLDAYMSGVGTRDTILVNMEFSYVTPQLKNGSKPGQGDLAIAKEHGLNVGLDSLRAYITNLDERLVSVNRPGGASAKLLLTKLELEAFRFSPFVSSISLGNMPHVEAITF